MPRMNLGAHMSIAGGLHLAFARAEAAGCRSLQIFSKNERQWRATPLIPGAGAQFEGEGARSRRGPGMEDATDTSKLGLPCGGLWAIFVRRLGYGR